MPIFHDQCSSAAHLAMASVRFSNTPEYHYIPTPVEDSNWRGVEIQQRVFTKEHPVKYRPKTDGQDVRDALATAKMLRSTIEAMDQGPACKFRCKTEFGCLCCIAPGLSVGCPAKGNQTDPAIEMEWIADTGSAQDLISESMLGEVKEFKSERPINMITANGPSYADKQCKVRVPSISTTAESYVLPDSPSVLSVGQKCVEEGFDFVWRANCRPYPRDSNGNKVYMDVRDNAPYLKSWKENVALPAKFFSEPIVPAPPAERPGKGIEECEKIAKELLDNLDFQFKSCLKLLLSMKCKPSKSNRLSVPKGGKSTDGNVEYIVLGAFAHGGVQGITKRTHQYPNARRYLSAFLENHGMTGDCSSICINHGSSIKVHKDAHNMKDTKNHTISLGNFEGGEIWIHDPAARKGRAESHRPKGGIEDTVWSQACVSQQTREVQPQNLPLCRSLERGQMEHYSVRQQSCS